MINRNVVSEQDIVEIAKKLIADIKKLCNGKVALKPESMPAMSLRDYKELHTLVTNLSEIDKLSDETYAEALKLVSEKISAVRVSTLQKQKSQTGRNSRTLDGNFTYYQNSGASRSSDFEGGQSKISKGYSLPSDTQPSVTVKRLKGDDYNKSVKNAAHEAKYIGLFNRHVHMYSNGKGGVLVSDYLEGEAVKNREAIVLADFSRYKYSRRFKWLLSGLNDLDVLHARYRLHGDVKPQNFILNIPKDEMRLMDFGCAHKVGSKKHNAFTYQYIDRNEVMPNKLASDMYAIGYVTAILFPELFKLNATMMMRPVELFHDCIMMAMVPCGPFNLEKIKTSNLTPAEKAVISFVDALMETNAEHRCTNLQAIEFCKQILAVKDGELNEATLEDILSKTLNRKEFEVEDALRNSKRPAMIASGESPEEDERKQAGDKALQSTATLFNPAQEKREKMELEQAKKNMMRRQFG